MQIQQYNIAQQKWYNLCFSSLLELPTFHLVSCSWRVLSLAAFLLKSIGLIDKSQLPSFFGFHTQIICWLHKWVHIQFQCFFLCFSPFMWDFKALSPMLSMLITSLQTQHMVLCLSLLNPFTQLNFAPVNRLRLNTHFADRSFKLQTNTSLKKTLHTTDHIAPENKRMWWTNPFYLVTLYMKLRQRLNFHSCILTCVIPTMCPIVIASY